MFTQNISDTPNFVNAHRSNMPVFSVSGPDPCNTHVYGLYIDRSHVDLLNNKTYIFVLWNLDQSFPLILSYSRPFPSIPETSGATPS